MIGSIIVQVLDSTLRNDDPTGVWAVVIMAFAVVPILLGALFLYFEAIAKFFEKLKLSKWRNSAKSPVN